MAFQTSCVSAANIVTGLTFQQDVVADAEGREMVQHGSALFPHCLLRGEPEKLFGGLALARGV